MKRIMIFAAVCLVISHVSVVQSTAELESAPNITAYFFIKVL